MTFTEDFSSVLTLNGLENKESSSTFTPNHYKDDFAKFTIEENMGKINLIFNKIEEIISEIKVSKYEQKILLNKWTRNKNQWDIFKKEVEIRKELFDFFEIKKLFNKKEKYNINYLEPNPKNREVIKSKEEIEIILNKITEIKNKIENINIEKDKKENILKELGELYKSWEDYKTQI